ncbi:MAG TPA: hypothetical protein VGC45_16025 [Gryllotalpicola sp.]
MSDSRREDFDDEDVDLEGEFPADVEDYEPEDEALDEDELDLDDDFESDEEGLPDEERPTGYGDEFDTDDEEFDNLDDE